MQLHQEEEKKKKASSGQVERGCVLCCNQRQDPAEARNAARWLSCLSPSAIIQPWSPAVDDGARNPPLLLV